MSENRFKEPKLRTDPKQRKIFQDKPREGNGRKCGTELENDVLAQELEGTPFPEPACRLHFCCHIPNTFTLKEMF